MAAATVSLSRDAAQVAALLDLPEIKQLIADLNETRWTGRPGYPVPTMVGAVLVKVLYAKRQALLAGLMRYHGQVTSMRETPVVKRPGAGVEIDRVKLKRLREEHGLSRAILAAKMSDNGDEFSYTPDAVAKLENGWRRPKADTLRRLCDVLGCDPEFLMLPVADGGPRECQDCHARFGHEPGCPQAT